MYACIIGLANACRLWRALSIVTKPSCYLKISPLNYSNHVLQISSGIDEVGGVRWELFAYLLLAWVAAYFVVWKGLHNSTKVKQQRLFKRHWGKGKETNFAMGFSLH